MSCRKWKYKDFYEWRMDADVNLVLSFAVLARCGEVHWLPITKLSCTVDTELCGFDMITAYMRSERFWTRCEAGSCVLSSTS